MSYTSTTSNYTQHHLTKKLKSSSINGAQTNHTTKTKPSSSNPNTQRNHNSMSQSLKETTFNNITSTFYKSTLTNYSDTMGETYYLFPNNKSAIFSSLKYDSQSDKLSGYIKDLNLSEHGISAFFPEDAKCKSGIKLHKLPDDSLTYINNNLIPRCNRLRN